MSSADWLRRCSEEFEATPEEDNEDNEDNEDEDEDGAPAPGAASPRRRPLWSAPRGTLSYRTPRRWSSLPGACGIFLRIAAAFEMCANRDYGFNLRATRAF